MRRFFVCRGFALHRLPLLPARVLGWGLGLFAFAMLALLLAMSCGGGLGVTRSWQALLAHGSDLDSMLVYRLRLPRALAAFGCGGLLALAGGLMQLLLRTPLADPYILGLSGGAACGALSVMLLGGGLWLVQGGAATGALLSSLLILALARRDLAWPSPVGNERLLLTGVMLAAAWGALVSLILSLAPERELRGMLFWLLGDLGGVRSAWPVLIALALALLLIAPGLGACNLLARGDIQARVLGVPVGRLKCLIFVVAAFATAMAVMTGGSIGFVGLVVPHALRLGLGNDQRLLLPACALAGGGVLVCADTLARSVAAPLQLPVGAVMALAGAPMFLYLLLRRGSIRT